MPTGDLFTAPATPRVERDAVTIEVLGRPSPKGSMRAFVVRGRAVITAGNDSGGLKLWAGLVAAAARESMVGRTLYVNVPLVVSITFRMARPGGHLLPRGGLRKSAPRYPSTKPDIDKLARSTLDALTGAVFDDDSRIVSLTCMKVYDETPGALIIISEMA